MVNHKDFQSFFCGPARASEHTQALQDIVYARGARSEILSFANPVQLQHLASLIDHCPVCIGYLANQSFAAGNMRFFPATIGYYGSTNQLIVALCGGACPQCLPQIPERAISGLSFHNQAFRISHPHGETIFGFGYLVGYGDHFFQRLAELHHRRGGILC